MTIFTGNKEKFHKYIGPFLRNSIQNITRTYKKKTGKCEHCGTKKKLEAAHIKGSGRKEIIDDILTAYKSENKYNVDLLEFETTFKEAHQDLNDIILVLCNDCHREYDKNEISKNYYDKIDISQKGRIYSNSKIQELISNTLKQNFSSKELEPYLDKDYSNKLFKINFPLLIKTNKSSNSNEKRALTKDSSEINRWSWKYEFEKDDSVYAITSQWYKKNDEFVKKWIIENTKS